MAKFIGFNTIGRQSAPFTLTDIKLVERDILNEFHTRLGERVMQPEFGTIIFDLLMDPADEVTFDAIRRDAIRIVSRDPRVELQNVSVTEFDDSIKVEIDLLFAPYNLQDTLYVTYQRSTESSTGSNLLDSTTIPGIN